MIREFKDKYSWLSNFSPCFIILHGITYPSVEHAYQSEKSPDDDWKLICQTKRAGSVKRESKKLDIDIKEWNKIKKHVMYICLSQKFSREPFRSLLLNTGEKEIQEGNYWGDEFWGVDLKTGKGKNELGKMIMTIRDRLNQKIF